LIRRLRSSATVSTKVRSGRWAIRSKISTANSSNGETLPRAIHIASSLIREIGFDPVLIGGLAMGKYLVPGTLLGGEHTAAEIRQIVTNLH
jgi:predicted dinucleotide-binding enzyme